MKVGDRVIIHTSNDKFMSQWHYKANSCAGTIQETEGSGAPYWHKVIFPNGYINYYPEHSLELIGISPLDEYEEIMAAQALMEGTK
jgi:hypothetical protein